MFFQGKKDEQILERAKVLFNNSVSAGRNWQSDAKSDHDFRNGKHWTDDEMQILADENRPCLTFNLVKPTIEVVMGLNEDNAPRIIAAPVEKTDGFLAEVINDVNYWVQKKYKFKQKKNLAFEAACICGRGYLAMDFTIDPKRIGFIDIIPTTIPAHELHLDPACRENDLSDASYIFWEKWISVEDFKVSYPEEAKDVEMWMEEGMVSIGSAEAFTGDVFNPHEVMDEDKDYETPLDTNFYDKEREQIRLVHMEYREAYDRYYGFNPQTGKIEEFPEKNLKALKGYFKQRHGQEFEYYKVKDKKVRWLQFIGDKILLHEDMPLPFNGFSPCPLFAYSDVSGRTQNHFGLVKGMKDPQKEINKRWSQAINLLNKQTMPGLRAEADAFMDIRQAEDAERTAGGITFLEKGGLTKIQERGIPSFPNAPVQMEQMSQDIMKRITGVNADLLGMDSGRHEPGVVVRMRQNQGMTILKRLFTAYADFDKEIFEKLTAIIMTHMPDEQILKVIGENDKYFIVKGQEAAQLGLQPTYSDGEEATYIIDKADFEKAQQQGTPPTLIAPIRNIRDIDYNIDTEEAPGNLTKKMHELQTYMELQQNKFPVDPMVLIERFDIPESEKQRWKEFIAAQQQAQQQAQEKEYQLRIMEIQTKNQIGAQKVQNSKIKDDHKAKVDEAKLELENKRQDLDYEARMAQTKVAASQSRMSSLLSAVQEQEKLKHERRKLANGERL